LYNKGWLYLLIGEAVDFIDFLTERKRQESPLIWFLSEPSGHRVGLEEVRRRPVKISGTMSDMVRELRDERELDRQINSLPFERLALSRDKAQVRALAEQGQVLESPRDVIKDPYVLEFLGLPEQAAYSKREMDVYVAGGVVSAERVWLV
jgi:hypothetical protein